MSIKVIQLFEKETSTFTYLVYEPETRTGAIIDPVDICFERDTQLIQNLKINLKYSLETHVHADHITSASRLRDEFSCEVGLSSSSGSSCADLLLTDSQELPLGASILKCIATPGHTRTCMSFYSEGAVFTGDALLINGCGRIDFQEGSAADLFSSVREKLFSLPEDTTVYPGHDYNGFTSSTVGYEKGFNSRLKLDHSIDDFMKIMSELQLAVPKKIDLAVPANINCGRLES